MDIHKQVKTCVNKIENLFGFNIIFLMCGKCVSRSLSKIGEMINSVINGYSQTSKRLCELNRKKLFALESIK